MGFYKFAKGAFKASFLYDFELFALGFSASYDVGVKIAALTLTIGPFTADLSYDFGAKK